MQTEVADRLGGGLAIVMAMTFTIAALVWAGPAEAQQHRVLAIHASRREAPGPVEMDRILQRVLGDRFGPALDYYAEYIDVARFPSLEYQSALRTFLAQKYAGQRFGAIIASTNTAALFVKELVPALFPGTPVVMSVGGGVKAWPGSAAIYSALDLARTLTLVSAMQPEIKQVFVVAGASEFDQFYVNEFRRQVEPLGQRFTITYWVGLPMPELLERLQHLPHDAILYPMTITEDGAGQRFVPLDAFDRLSAASNRPIYGWTTLVMDRGLVGGAMNSAEVLGRSLATLAVRVLRGEDPDTIDPITVDPIVTEVDWRQLQRWGIDERRLPAGTVVRFREPGLWDRYRAFLLGAGALLWLQTMLIVSLLVQGARRRRVEAALRTSHEENRDLVGRLITAQEAERTRIARDLHDDVSQQLAGLAITLSGLKRRVARSAPAPDIEETLTTLQQHTATLADDIRNLSHELHPGVLQHAGLVAALKTHCAEFERHHTIRVTLSAPDNVDALDPAVALCLYRVTQEALTNIARHAGAKAVQVRLARTPGAIELAVVDDGVGFDPGARRVSGLGLRSMDERVRFTKGRVVVQSQPGQGTRVLVEIPLRSTSPMNRVGPV